MKRLLGKMTALLAMLSLVACATPNGPAGDIAKRMGALESKVQTLEERNDDLRLKARIVSQHQWGSPLENFFAADEFWENPYDSGQADCARRCIAMLSEQRRVCAAMTDEKQRLACYHDALDRGSRCQTQCSANNPPPIP